MALTILLGVVALTSGNNVLYLIESLLLSGLILSGVLSERTLAALHVEVRRFPTAAGSPSRDQIIVTNKKNYPLFCIEIGDWAKNKLQPAAFIARIGPKGTIVIASKQKFEERGIYSWQGLAVATSYPFGFARKTRIIENPGERVIWPCKIVGQAKTRQSMAMAQGFSGGQEIVDGEVRPYTQDDDSRMIVWSLSLKAKEPMVRIRKSESSEPEVQLDLRGKSGPDFERRVQMAALPFYLQEDQSPAGTLTLIGSDGRRRIHGRNQVLNQLAVVEPETNPSDLPARKRGYR